MIACIKCQVEAQKKRDRRYLARQDEPGSKDAVVKSMLETIRNQDRDLTTAKARAEYWERRAVRAELENGKLLAEFRGLGWPKNH